MYKPLTRSHIYAELASLAEVGLSFIKIIICLVQTSDALPYTHGTRVPRLLRVRKYLNKNFSIYKRLMRSRIDVELAPPPKWG